MRVAKRDFSDGMIEWMGNWACRNLIQGKLGITRSLGPGNFVCSIRYLAISVVNNNTKQRKSFHWDQLLYQMSLCQVSTVKRTIIS